MLLQCMGVDRRGWPRFVSFKAGRRYLLPGAPKLRIHTCRPVIRDILTARARQYGSLLGPARLEDSMGILSWLIVGLVAGYIGSKLVNRTGEGLMRDLLLGVIGAIVGGAVFHALGYVGVTGVNLRSIFVAVVGAVIVLVTYHAVTSYQAARASWWR